MLDNVSLVMVSFNRLDILEKNIKKYLEWSDRYNLEAVFVDNNSTDGSAQFIKELKKSPLVKINLLNENIGVGPGRNIGRAQVSRPFCINVDDDTVMELEDLISMVNYMRSDQEVGALSPRIVQGETGELQTPSLKVGDLIANYHGACHLIRTDLMHKVGDIDKECNFGAEELDFSIRIFNLGYKVVHFSEVTVKHFNVIRTDGVGAWRIERRVYNFTRTNFKYFPPFVALLNSIRTTVRYQKLSFKRRYFLLFCKLPFHMVKGLVSGRRNRFPTSKSTIQIYNDASLEPEFGNKPLLSVFKRKI